mgnify:CR=1 FL=1
MYDVDPLPCTPAAFRVGDRSRPGHGVVSRNEGHPSRRYLEASLAVGWGVRLYFFAWCDGILLGLLHVCGCPTSGLEVLGSVLAGFQLLALLLQESDVDVTVLPNDHLLVTFSCPVRERCVTMPASSVRAVALVNDPDNEHRTFRAHLLFHGRYALDLGTADDTAVRVAAFLDRPLERYSPALPPHIQAGASATLAADA